MIPSCSPDSTSGLKPAARTLARKSAPLEASRTAAVATTLVLETPIWRMRIAKRRSAAIARSWAASESSPVLASPLPKPAITFSLKTIDGIRVAPE